MVLIGFSDCGPSVNAVRIADHGDPNNLKNISISDINNLGILLWEIYYEIDASEVDQYSMQHQAFTKAQMPRPVMENKFKYIQLYEECRDASPTIDQIVLNLEKLEPLEDDICKFNWKQLDDTYLDRETDKKTGVFNEFLFLFSCAHYSPLQHFTITGLEIVTELDQLNVNVIPYNLLRFTKMDFHRGGSTAIHRAILGENQVAVKLQMRHPADIIREVRILKMCDHRNIVHFHGITRYTGASQSFRVLKIANTETNVYF